MRDEFTPECTAWMENHEQLDSNKRRHYPVRGGQSWIMRRRSAGLRGPTRRLPPDRSSSGVSRRYAASEFDGLPAAVGRRRASRRIDP
jgi:hypothetical protein